MNKHLHIISLAVPYPPDYGGVFDIYYKVVELHKAGVKIHLHCFGDEGRHMAELQHYSEEVCYYPRIKGWKGFSFRLPYIVSSRLSRRLTERLLADDYPILIEGIHCSAVLNDPRFSSRMKVLRLHNVEHLYYEGLYRSPATWWKRMYYRYESILLKKYELKVAGLPHRVLAVSTSDEEYYRQEFGCGNVAWLPVFTGFRPALQEGTGCFCLYHGNLAVAENEKAVEWLLTNVVAFVDVPFIFAGRRPSGRLSRMIANYANATLVADPDSEVLSDLLSKAQCHLLPSFNQTGIKLKLLHALFRGRHCIVNSAAVEGSGCEVLCEVTESADTFRRAVLELYRTPFTREMAVRREQVLLNIFNDERNVHKLIQWIW